MFTIRRRFLLPPLALAAGLCLPAGADAATLCVSNPSCPAGATSYADLQSALTAARNNVAADEILVGPGTYTGAFTYDSNERLTLRGTSRAATILKNANGTALALRGDQATATNLRIESGGTYAATLRRGHLDNVTVSGDGADTTAVLAYGGSSITGSSLLSDSADAVHLIDEQATDKTTIASSSLYGGSAGVREQTTVPLDVDISSSHIEGDAPVRFGEGKLALRSSVLRTGSGGLLGLSLSGGADVKASNLTIDGQGSGSGIEVSTNSIADAKLDITSSIVTRYERGFRRAGGGGYDADVNARYTLYQGLQQTGPGTFVQANNPSWQTPPFVTGNSPIPNHRLVAPSTVAIDAGEPGLSAGAVDRDGRTRVVDGDGAGGARVDLGAYEYQRSAPVASIAAPTRVEPGQPVAFTATATDADPTETGKLAYAWNIDGASVSGKQATHTFATAGPRTVVLSVSDPGGRVTQVAHQIQVGAAGDSGGGAQGGGGQGGGGGGQGQPARDRTAPRLARFGPSAKRLRMSRTVSKRVTRRRGGQLRLRLSEAATVKLSFERRRGKRYRKAKGSLTIRGTKGLNRIGFGGRLSKKRTLRAGTYRVTAVAVDRAGNRSKAVRTTVTLVR